jgi:hypothetical protein
MSLSAPRSEGVLSVEPFRSVGFLEIGCVPSGWGGGCEEVGVSGGSSGRSVVDAPGDPTCVPAFTRMVLDLCHSCVAVRRASSGVTSISSSMRDRTNAVMTSDFRRIPIISWCCFLTACKTFVPSWKQSPSLNPPT